MTPGMVYLLSMACEAVGQNQETYLEGQAIWWTRVEVFTHPQLFVPCFFYSGCATLSTVVLGVPSLQQAYKWSSPLCRV